MRILSQSTQTQLPYYFQLLTHPKIFQRLKSSSIGFISMLKMAIKNKLVSTKPYCSCHHSQNLDNLSRELFQTFGKKFSERINYPTALVKMRQVRTSQSWAAGQAQIARIKVYFAVSQQGHVATSTIFIFLKLTRVGNTSWQALHAKFFTAFGTIKAHRGFQTS